MLNNFKNLVGTTVVAGCLATTMLPAANAASKCTVDGKQIDCLKINLTTGGLKASEGQRKTEGYAEYLVSKSASGGSCPLFAKQTLENHKHYSCVFYKGSKHKDVTPNLLLTVSINYKNPNPETPAVVQCQYAFDFSRNTYKLNSFGGKGACTKLINAKWAGTYPYGELNIVMP